MHGPPKNAVMTFLNKIYNIYKTERERCLGENVKILYKNYAPTLPEGREKIYLFWFRGKMNFGDRLSPIITKILSGREIKSEPPARPKIPHLLAIGTILQFARDDDIIWGTGFRNDRLMNTARLDVRAVRGPLTRKYLQDKKIECPEVYGDPAILMPYLFKPAVKKEKFGIGIAKHYSDKSDFQKFRNYNIKEIDITQNPLKVIMDICSCEVILSSCLHAIITAESYGIPTCWLYPEESLWITQEPIIKYQDYYLSTLREPLPYRYSSGDLDIETAIKMAHKNKRPEFECEKLLMSFPFLRRGISSIGHLNDFLINDIVTDVSKFLVVGKTISKIYNMV
jgi:pyruvyltransferase